MDPDQTCRVVLRFFKEVRPQLHYIYISFLQSLSEGESKYWSLTTELEGHVQHLIKAVQTPWENMFETTLPITYR